MNTTMDDEYVMDIKPFIHWKVVAEKIMHMDGHLNHMSESSS